MTSWAFFFFEYDYRRPLGVQYTHPMLCRPPCPCVVSCTVLYCAPVPQVPVDAEVPQVLTVNAGGTPEKLKKKKNSYSCRSKVQWKYTLALSTWSTVRDGKDPRPSNKARTPLPISHSSRPHQPQQVGAQTRDKDAEAHHKMIPFFSEGHLGWFLAVPVSCFEDGRSRVEGCGWSSSCLPCLCVHCCQQLSACAAIHCHPADCAR